MSASGNPATPAEGASAVRRLPVLALLGANAVSHTGNVLTNLAVPWFVLETTGSPARTGVTLFVTALPNVIAGFFGGTLVDRIGYKRMSILSDLASGVTVALIPLLYHTVGLAFWQLLVLVFLGALLDAPGATARSSLLPDLAALARMPLERANAASLAIARGARLVGAPLGGLLIATLGASTALWLDAVTFAVSALVVALFVPARRAAGEIRGHYLTQLADGLGFIRAHRLIRILLLFVGLTNVLGAPMAVALPVFAREVYDSAAAWGTIVAGGGAGAIAGAAGYGWLGPRLSRRRTFILCFIGAGLPYWLLALWPPLPVAVLAMTFGNICAAPINPVISSIFQERIPPQMRGRVLGTIEAVATMATPLGLLTGGYLLERVGLRPVMIGVAACYVAASVSMLLSAALHEMDRHPTGDAAPDTASSVLPADRTGQTLKEE